MLPLMPRNTASADTAAIPERLLEVAASAFAQHGFAGARLEDIAREVGITRAMVYYYFGGREGLYVATLDAAYRAIWQAEQGLSLEHLAPAEALRRLVEFRVDYYIEHPEFVALVSIENQHGASYLKRAAGVMASASPSLERTRAVLREGQARGLFRRDIDVVDLYQVMVSLAFFNVSNRHTFGAIFGRGAGDGDGARVRHFVADAVLRYVAAPSTG